MSAIAALAALFKRLDGTLMRVWKWMWTHSLHACRWTDSFCTLWYPAPAWTKMQAMSLLRLRFEPNILCFNCVNVLRRCVSKDGWTGFGNVS